MAPEDSAVKTNSQKVDEGQTSKQLHKLRMENAELRAERSRLQKTVKTLKSEKGELASELAQEKGRLDRELKSGG